MKFSGALFKKSNLKFLLFLILFLYRVFTTWY